MKFVAIIASLASLAVAADVSTTITCPDCKTPSSTNDMVTRSPLPTTDCDAPSLTVVKTGSAQSTGGMNPSASGSQTGSPTGVPPVTGGAGRVAGGALAAAVAAVALL